MQKSRKDAENITERSARQYGKVEVLSTDVEGNANFIYEVD